MVPLPRVTLCHIITVQLVAALSNSLSWRMPVGSLSGIGGSALQNPHPNSIPSEGIINAPGASSPGLTVPPAPSITHDDHHSEWICSTN
ncbi:hypothetical protein GYMLUDRAFT_241380 [Collybiopsis luxurians FD-317 M1]|uniref:Secreted protein n=1 Tax=Collybiopsis luxurians FD-317 M1 TaxID=944289 RepID=A0A0D0D4A5_9AGAR|nr:hypothetical protein GYMLUDRAFT_241380 [Collybiopsis luxurians FD-317 M1]